MASTLPSGFSLLFGLFACCYLAAFLSHINNSLLIADDLLGRIGEFDLVIESKLLLLLRFGRQFLKAVTLAIVCTLMVTWLPISNSVTVLVEEVMYLAITSLDVYFFWITKTHAGPEGAGIAPLTFAASELTAIDEPGEPTRIAILRRVMER
jgi:hypothetical protein